MHRAAQRFRPAPAAAVQRALACKACAAASLSTGASAATATASRAPLRPQRVEDLGADGVAAQEAYLKRLSAREHRVHAKRKKVLDASADDAKVPSFASVLHQRGCGPLRRKQTEIMQVNIGLLCNLSCEHCHVESSPERVAENMGRRTADRLIQLMDQTPGLKTLDITGGAPELNYEFRYLVRAARERGLDVIDRCNLTVLLEPGQEDTAQFLADNKVKVVASLPCYTLENVEKQRGTGVFDQSIEVLQKLNALGYGHEGTGLELNLVYNPLGPYLPGSQVELATDYKRELKKHFDISFNNLFTITNMPIRRFADFLVAGGEYSKYMQLLLDNFNPSTVDDLMCRNTVSISWDGRLYDCDFNQMLHMPAAAGLALSRDEPPSIWNIDNLNFDRAAIATDRHCFGCTAGAGSSCGGALE